MEIIENEASVWDDIWQGTEPLDLEAIRKNIEITKQSKPWRHYNEIVQEKLGGWKNVKAVEIGSGMGWHNFMAATEGAEVTFLDYSQPALDLARKRAEAFSLNASYIFGDAFEILKESDRNYNLSWSFGTAEHFKGEKRQQFFELHFEFMVPGGVAIISCPYKYALNYRIWMHYASKYKEWTYGLEIPYSKTEYLRRLKLSENKLIKVFFDEGRPCLNKMMGVLKKHSKMRYSLFYAPIRVIQKLHFKLPPFNYRSVILIAEKT